jgi:Shedu protein SduA, C-terminal
MADYDDWLERFSVPRPSGLAGLADRFEKLLDTAEREEELQKFFEENPFILADQLPHCHHVIPKFRLGGQFVTDFLLPEMTSGGTVWVLVELEPAQAQLVTAQGQLADRVRVGVQQLKDWRDWLRDNKDMAIRPRSKNGLGLDRIDGIWSWAVVGRRSQVTERFNQLRAQVRNDSSIEILTYDRLLEWFKKRAQVFEAWDAHLKNLSGEKGAS